MQLWIMVAAACVSGCANQTGPVSPSPVAVASPSSSSSCAVPDVPTELSADVSGRSVNLDWSDVSDATDYVVLIGRTGTSAETLLTNTISSQYAIDDAPAGRHFVRVHAHNWCGTSAATMPVAFTIR
jgi:hypothetical protein